MKVQQPPLGTPLNRSHPLSQGLVGCFPLNEGGGQIALDNTGIGIQNGTLTSGATFTNTAKGSAVLFDGVNDYISCTNSTTSSYLSSPAAFGSISAWINLNLLGTNKGIVSKGDAAVSDRNGYIFRVSSANKILLEICSASASKAQGGATSLVTNIWYHAACTWSNTTITVYLNGVNDGTSANTISAVSNVYPLKIGAENNNAGSPVLPFDGYITNVQIWNRCLNQSEIRSLYQNPYQMFK